MTRRGLARFAAPPAAAPPASAPPASPPQEPEASPLARFLTTRAPPTPGEACEMCATPVPADHRHAVDLERRGLLCVCQGCSLLFVDATTGRYRTVPDRYLRIQPFTLPPLAWSALQIPVGMAFVVDNSMLQRNVAFYPSPGGATESELPMDAWSEIVAANPALARVEPDVEAVLLRTTIRRGGAEAGSADGAADRPHGTTASCHVVPVDRCYELVGVLRMHWRGFDGGQEVREHLDAFFADVARRARPAS